MSEPTIAQLSRALALGERVIAGAARKQQTDNTDNTAPRVSVSPDVSVSELGAAIFPGSVTVPKPKMSAEQRRAKRTAAQREARKKARQDTLATNCEHCAAEIQPTRSTKRFCSDRCRMAAKRAATQA